MGTRLTQPQKKRMVFHVPLHCSIKLYIVLKYVDHMTQSSASWHLASTKQGSLGPTFTDGLVYLVKESRSISSVIFSSMVCCEELVMEAVVAAAICFLTSYLLAKCILWNLKTNCSRVELCVGNTSITAWMSTLMWYLNSLAGGNSCTYVNKG